jgi:WD40 repeat protein
VDAAAPVILLNNHAGQVQALAVSADGSRLACADSGQAVHLWDLASHRPLRVLGGFEGEVRCLAFRGDGDVLASGGSDRVVHLWSPGAAADAEEEHARPGPAGEAFRTRSVGAQVGLAPAPDGARLASLSPGKGVRVWEVATAPCACGTRRAAPPTPRSKGRPCR